MDSEIKFVIAYVAIATIWWLIKLSLEPRGYQDGGRY